MADTKNEGLFSCAGICWMLAIAFGIVVALWFQSGLDRSWLVSLVLGLIALLGAGWLLTGYFCDGLSNTAPTQAAAKETHGVDSQKPSVSADASMAEAIVEHDADAEPAGLATLAAETTASKPSTPKKKPSPTSADLPKGMEPAADGKPALYIQAPTDADDLKKIKGVGPSLEGTLNDLGIYTFAQIAQWKAKDIAWVDGNLKFKGRIKRDDWVKQAKAFLKG